MRSPQRLGLTQTQRLALNTSLQASIGLLRLDAAGLTRYLEEQAAANPHLRLDPAPAPAVQDWLPRWTGLFRPAGASAAADTDTVASAAPSLIAHVLASVDALGLPLRARRIALALTEALEPSGWINTPLATIAAETGASIPEVEQVLKTLQGLEPVGIFARNLAECLRLQAIDAGALDMPMAFILDHLDLLANGDLARLAKACAVTEAQIMARFRIIRSMNPKPGADFAPANAAHVREPDLVVRPVADGWAVALNRSALPALRIEKIAAGSAADLAAAKSLQLMLDARNSTLLAVAAEMLQRQQEAMRDGMIAMAPMTMADIAAALDLHESTISRVVAGASLDTPRGTWWLRQMFSPALGGDGAPTLSALSLRHRLTRLISAENPQTPLTDGDLVTKLALETGISIARRTVAKYREQQGIPPASGRKRKARLASLSASDTKRRIKG